MSLASGFRMRRCHAERPTLASSAHAIRTLSKQRAEKPGFNDIAWVFGGFAYSVALAKAHLEFRVVPDDQTLRIVFQLSG